MQDAWATSKPKIPWAYSLICLAQDSAISKLQNIVVMMRPGDTNHEACAQCIWMLRSSCALAQLAEAPSG